MYANYNTIKKFDCIISLLRAFMSANVKIDIIEEIDKKILTSKDIKYLHRECRTMMRKDQCSRWTILVTLMRKMKMGWPKNKFPRTECSWWIVLEDVLDIAFGYPPIGYFRSWRKREPCIILIRIILESAVEAELRMCIYSWSKRGLVF